MPGLVPNKSYVTVDLVKEYEILTPRSETWDQGAKALGKFLHRNSDEFVLRSQVMSTWFGADPRYRRGPGIGFGSVWFSRGSGESPGRLVPIPVPLTDHTQTIGNVRSVFARHVNDAVRQHKRIEYEVILPLLVMLQPIARTFKEDAVMEALETNWDAFIHNWKAGGFSQRISRAINVVERADFAGEFANKLEMFGERLSLSPDNTELSRLSRFGKILDTQIDSMLDSLHRMQEVMSEVEVAFPSSRGRALVQRIEGLNWMREVALDMSTLLRKWYGMHLEISTWSHRLELSTWMETFERESIGPSLRMLDSAKDVSADILSRFAHAENVLQRFRHDWLMEYDSIRDLVPEDIRGFVVNASHYVKGLVAIVLPQPEMMKMAIERTKESLFRGLADNWEQVRMRFMDHVNDRPALDEIEHLFGTLDFGDVEVMVRGKDNIRDHVNNGVLFMTLFQLVINSTDHRREGRPLAVLIKAERMKDLTKVVVRDNGKGMTRERLAQVKKGLGVNSIKPHGTGLGISTIYNQLLPRLVRGHVGLAQMDIWSNPREGSRFTIYIPDPPAPVISPVRNVRVLR